MIIQRIQVRQLGDIAFFETRLTPGINVIDSRFHGALSAAIGVLLCSKTAFIPRRWLRKSTRITARIKLNDRLYFVEAAPTDRPDTDLTLRALDRHQADVTAQYLLALSHCREQDAVEHFDGLDKTAPLRIFRYKNSKDRYSTLDRETEYYSETKAFRAQLSRYIKAFRPEPINNKKDYMLFLDQQGVFTLACPGVSRMPSLSETEEKLFFYLCFLNTAEFWEKLEEIRDMHHEKKPLLIQNFLEFLDESTKLEQLIQRTGQLQRQIIILTLPLEKDVKEKWTTDP